MEEAKLPKRFRSCFIRDVSVSSGEAVLEDTGGFRWKVDLRDQKLAKQFASWLKTEFLARRQQLLHVFQYETERVSECEVEAKIVGFCGIASGQQRLDG